MKDVERHILGDWSRLGILWNVPASRRTPDVESLIVRSLALIPDNSRMLVLLSSWLSVFWRCVGRDRLLRLAFSVSAEEQAALGIVLETTNSWLPAPIFAGLLKRLTPVEPPRPLFNSYRARPALARLAELESSPIARRWGLWCLPVERKINGIRPTKWVLDKNPALKSRALFKGSLKTSILAALDATGALPVGPTTLARNCGVTRKAVYDALDDLRFAGMLRPMGPTSSLHGVGRTT